MKIYTKTGDDGYTSLLGGNRVTKNSLRIDCYGTVDELNAFVSLLRVEVMENYKANLWHIQQDLFVLGSQLASDKSFSNNDSIPKIKIESIDLLESWIDNMELQLPSLKNFIIPGGDKLVSYANICRTICRRAERLVVELSQHDYEDLDNVILQYLNRLSDYFFVLGRAISHELGLEEEKWIYKK